MCCITIKVKLKTAILFLLAAGFAAFGYFAVTQKQKVEREIGNETKTTCNIFSSENVTLPCPEPNSQNLCDWQNIVWTYKVSNKTYFHAEQYNIFDNIDPFQCCVKTKIPGTLIECVDNSEQIILFYSFIASCTLMLTIFIYLGKKKLSKEKKDTFKLNHIDPAAEMAKRRANH